jgi:hypothetical protein
VYALQNVRSFGAGSTARRLFVPFGSEDVSSLRSAGASLPQTPEIAEAGGFLPSSPAR